MTRIATPFDLFLRDFLAWVDSAWFVWIALAVAIALVVVIVSITKVRARSRSRLPQYRRQS